MIWLALYIGTIFAANWSLSTFGVVPVGFALYAPAAAYFAGLALTFRDLVDDRLGLGAVVLAILVGAVLSMFVSPTFAIASGVAFLFSELADLVVYQRIRSSGWLGAIFLSNLVGLVVDSVLFLALAFGSLDFLAGQVVAKTTSTIAAVAFLAVVRDLSQRSRN